LILKVRAFVFNPLWNRLPDAKVAAAEHAIANE